MPQAPTTGKYKWLATKCAAPVKTLDGHGFCGKRQFRAPGGEVCKDGHGGADGIEMTADEIATWDKLYWDGEQPDDPDFEEPPGMSGLVWADSWCSQTYRGAGGEHVKNRGSQQVCGLRQFSDKDGDATCARGHYAVGWPMTLADLDVWVRKSDTDAYKVHFPKNSEPEPELPCVGPGDVGAVVTLKGSVHLLMTVEVAPTDAKDKLCECIWFTTDGKLQRGTFLIKTLRLARLDER